MSSEVFTSKFRVYYEDTDAGGIVYHTNYLKFCERCRSDVLREVLHFDQQKHINEDKQAFVVSKLNAKFVSPAVLDDELTVSCIPLNFRRCSLDMYQEIYNQDGKLLFAMCSTIAYITFAQPHNKLTDIPEEVVSALRAYEAAPDLRMRC